MRDGHDERVTKWKANEASCDRRMKMVGGGRMGMGVGMVGMDGMAEGELDFDFRTKTLSYQQWDR